MFDISLSPFSSTLCASSHSVFSLYNLTIMKYKIKRYMIHHDNSIIHLNTNTSDSSMINKIQRYR